MGKIVQSRSLELLFGEVLTQKLNRFFLTLRNNLKIIYDLTKKKVNMRNRYLLRIKELEMAYNSSTLYKKHLSNLKLTAEVIWLPLTQYIAN